MSRGKYQNKRKPFPILPVVLIALLVVALTSGGAVAYLARSGNDPVTNSFVKTPNPSITVDNDDYSVTVNTGNADHQYAVYLRAAVVPNWKNGNNVIAVSPDKFTVTKGTDWFLHSDGFYYYTKPISNGTTSPIYTAIETTSNPGGMLEVDIAVQAIQALGTTDETPEILAVLDAWGIPIQSIDSGASPTDPT